jgi:hypothetical protein
VVFLLGAGASCADGVLIQSEIIPSIYTLNDKIMKKSNAYKEVINFINTFFKPDIHNNLYPTLEQIYSYMEYHLNNNENINNNYNVERLKRVKTCFNYILHYVINKTSIINKKGIYKQFWDRICKLNKNISIITLNYDTVLEESFESFYMKEGLIDYTIDFINYDNGLNVGNNWWIDPTEPIKVPDDVKNKESIVPIKIIKPHGSLNWKYCNCCNRVFLTHWQNEVDLNNLTFEDTNAHSDITKKCPYDKSYYNQLIIPPTHCKKMYNRIFLDLFSQCIREIRRAKKICFIGYSFPEFDIHIKAIFDKVNLMNKKIYCVNPSVDNKMMFNYRLIKNNITFIEQQFEEFINSKIFEELVKP